MQDIELTIRRVKRKSASKDGDSHESVRWPIIRVGLLPVAVVMLGVLTIASALTAQEPQPKQSISKDKDFALRQTVRRVRVDVVVTDAQGKPVKDLQAANFRVAEDGKPQSIRQFEYHSDEMVEAALPTRPTLPPHTFMNLPVTPEHGPLTVIVYDKLNTPLFDQLDARAQMVKFLKKISGRRVAIYVIDNQLRFVQGFTSDPDLIDRAIGPAAKPQQPQQDEKSIADNSASKWLGVMKAKPELIEKAKAMEDKEANERMDRRVDLTTDALKQIARFLAGIPGRKNLIWYTGSFPINANSGYAHAYKDRIKDAVNWLNSAEVSVYCIDARGLIGMDLDSPKELDPSMKWDFSGNASKFATMDELSEQTGGRAFYSTNGLEEALEKASAEGTSYYSLLYAPTNAKYDGSVRSISVHLAGHEKYHLAYRRSYIADDVASIASKQSAAEENSGEQGEAFASAVTVAADAQFGAPPTHQIVFAAHVDAIGQPVPATTIQMAALEPYRKQMAKVEHKKFVAQTAPVAMQQYAIKYAVLASQLDIPKSAEGRYHSDLSFAALAFSRDGETLWGAATRLKDDIPAAMIDKIRKDGFQSMQKLFIPVETAVIRLMVCDEHSGKTGSMEIRLPLLPDQQQTARAQ
jgi:VWFA-related protein